MTNQQKELLEMWFGACREYFEIFLKTGRARGPSRQWPNLTKYWRLNRVRSELLDKMLEDLQEATGYGLDQWEKIERAYRKMAQK